jgi:hypothetical protein
LSRENEGVPQTSSIILVKLPTTRKDRGTIKKRIR